MSPTHTLLKQSTPLAASNLKVDSDQNGGHFQKVIIGHAELKWLEDALSRLFSYAETGMDRQLFTYIGVYGGTILSNVAMLLGPLVDQRPTNKSVITTEVELRFAIADPIIKMICTCWGYKVNACI